MEVESPNAQQQRQQVVTRPSNSKTSPSKLAFFKAKAAKYSSALSPFRNPYLNFLREFRKRNVGLSAVETVKRGAKEWRTLPKDKKLKYIEAAFYAPKRRKPLGRQTAVYSEMGSPEDCGCKPKRKKKSCRKKKVRKNRCGRKRRPKRRGCKKRRRRRKKC